MIESEADRLQTLRAAGEPARVDGIACYVIHNSNFVEVLDGLVGSSAETIFGRASDLAHAKRGSVVEIGESRFAVAGAPQPDGTGMLRLTLKALA